MNIQKISLRDVVFSGHHGATEAEQADAQRFQVEATLSFDAQPSIVSEQLSDTIDYFDVIKIIRTHIENRDRKHALLETLVEEISQDIAKTFSCFHVELSIKKLDVPFCPQIGTAKSYFSKRAVPMKSFEEIHDALITTGLVSTPFLNESERFALLEHARTLELVRQPEMTESGIVREDLSSCTVKGEGTGYAAIADRVALFLGELARATGQSFMPMLPKPDMSIQKYEQGSFGITPHRDELRFGICVCIIPLVGKGELAVCDDREGNNKKPVDTTPGNLILLRAPGYANLNVRPMHTLYDITAERIVLGIRFATNK